VKLRRIELQGFKSFLERTRLEFDEGITAILGPNGCGKSNIVDAVRWVLGEQSPRQLRGDRMDDVIFKGTTKRKPVGLCEVTLVFDNESRRLPIDFDEVAIRRRVTRDGHSEYFLNGSPCRLKDLRDLLYDSGAGNTAYAIIEHAMINQVLNENAQELRRLLEEGSGITKYKARRKETERKLERTQQDLLRIDDLIEEIGKEVRSLRYQVGKARRHQRLYREIRALDLLVAGRRQRAMDGEEAQLRSQHQELRALAEADSGELAELRAQIEATRPAVAERQAERSRLEESLQACEEDLQETERQVFLLEHRVQEHQERATRSREELAAIGRRRQELREQIAGLQAQLEELSAQVAGSRREVQAQEEECAVREDRLQSERGALERAAQLNLEFIENDAEQQGQLRELQVKQEERRSRLGELGEQIEVFQQEGRSVEERLAGLQETRQRLVVRRRELLAELAAAERGVDELSGEAARLRDELSAKQAQREALVSRRDLLRRIRDEHRGYGRGARWILQEQAGHTGVRGGLAERFQVADGETAPFEALFGELLESVVVDGPATAVDLVGRLCAGEGGRASFLCQEAASSEAGETAAPSGPAPAGGRPASELIGGEGSRLPHVARLLARTWVFADDAQALAAAAAHEGDLPLICLSASGLLVTSDGVVRGGRGAAEEVGLLGRGQKLEKLAGQITSLERQIKDHQEKLRDRLDRHTAAREELLRRRGEQEILEEELGKVQAEAAGLQSRQDSLRQRLAAAEGEQANLESELAGLAAAESRLMGRMEESGRQRSDSTTRLDGLRRAVATAEGEREEARTALADLRLLAQRQEGQQRQTETALEHLRESLGELGSRQEALEQEIELGEQERVELDRTLQTRREALGAAGDERERRRRLVRAAAEAIQELHEQTAGWHDRIKEIEDKRSACREEIHQIETRLATLDVQRRNLQERIEEQYKGTFRELVRSFDPEHLPRELEREGEVFQLEQAAELLADRREKLAGLGPVNHLALEEYEGKSERLTFLEGQRQDVVRAKEDLETAIARINRTARKRFGETFAEVRRNFVSVFEVLFEGGHADLQLIRTDDPLESEIHILAQPRGKIVDHVALLSGGERCLTALSLLFAVYLVKPSPFCMLDEVDAPLDDSNIQRFVRMLREFSRNTQFLVVTHNKLSMETANHLYGVTMMEEGVSSIVSVSFQDVAQTQSDAELGRAIASRRQALVSEPELAAVELDEEATGAETEEVHQTAGVRSPGEGEDKERRELEAEQ
jgi:chromosome segregation protein